jgi:hypothetical protein
MDWEKQETMRILQSKPGTVYQEGNENDRKVYRDWLKKMLQVGVTNVTFVKADGSLRTMKATLDPVVIPLPAIPNALLTENKKEKTQNDDVCKVWDTEANAWRSFRYDRIKSITVELG